MPSLYTSQYFLCVLCRRSRSVYSVVKIRTRQARPSRIQARLSICANPQDSPFPGGTGLSRPQSLPRVRSSTIGRARAWPSHMHLWPVHNAFCVFRGRFSAIALHAMVQYMTWREEDLSRHICHTGDLPSSYRGNLVSCGNSRNVYYAVRPNLSRANIPFRANPR